jgi:non-specific serine/threonine protein kinase
MTPHGRLVTRPADDAATPELARAVRIEEAFVRGPGHGLLLLGAAEVGTVLPPAFAWFRELGARLVTEVCGRAASAEPVGAPAPPPPPPPPPPSDEELTTLVNAAPPMPGSEYLTPTVLRGLWIETGAALCLELEESGLSLQEFLKQRSPAWNLVGRVHFNLAENRRDDEAPFAFLATYTTHLSAHGKAQHVPLGQALREYAGAANKDRLLSLLVPVQRAAEEHDWLKRMVDEGEIFHPLRFSVDEAQRLLGDADTLRRAGVIVRMPSGWTGGRPSRPRVTGTVGAKAPSGLGVEALLDFRMAVTLDGETLTPREIKDILSRTSGLHFLRGRWVEIDRDRLARTMRQLEEAERLASGGGLGFAEALRLLAGADVGASNDAERPDPDWSQIAAGSWLAETLRRLRSPEELERVSPGRGLRGTLRPYQEIGVRWLDLLSRLGLGACLADDMGLGKTVQVLSLLLVQRASAATHRPSLLVAPASLLGNWSAEIERFTPDLRRMVAHPSALPAGATREVTTADLAGLDLVITSYGSLLRLPWLLETDWHLAILDEAQAIKNPGAKQSRAARALKARARIALTGTPIENRLGDLWSIFDFLNPGLLGSAKAFTGYTRRMATTGGNAWAPLRDLLRPYILRRLKTDRRVITDLPEKTEVKAFCPLSRKQAALYQEAVRELRERLEATDGIERRGVVLASLTRLKQICNHPSQWLGDGAWSEADSGKWGRLREIAEVLADKQEKALVFTQFREVTGPLAAFLGGLYGRPGLVLHGETAVAARRGLVERFQDDESIPFMVLSLKAGGAGLNLTAARHVIHFDRWWNPAVENQATDRAFRIGQKNNVLVHKFVCRGTVEDKIDALIEDKNQLSRDLLEGGAELNLTELGDQALLDLVRLDLDAAMGDAA